MAIASDLKEKLKVVAKKITHTGTPKKVIIIGSEYKVGEATILALAGLHSDEVEPFAGTKDKIANPVGIPGVQTVKADLADKSGLTVSLVGYDAAYIVVPLSASASTLTVNGIEAAKEAGVKFVALLSVMNTDTDEAQYEKDFAPIKEAIENSGLDYAVVRLPLNEMDAEKPIAVGDVGKESAKILADPQKHSGKTYTLETAQ